MSGNIRLIAALSVVSALACAHRGAVGERAPGGAPEFGRFTITRAGDTAAVESFEQRPTFLAGEIRAPGQPWIRYRVETGPEGRPTSLSFTVYPAGKDADAPPLQRIDAVVLDDSLFLEVSGAAGSGNQRLRIGRDAWVVVGQSTAMTAHLINSIKRGAADSVAIPVYRLPAGPLTPLTARFFNADSARVTFGATSIVHFGRDGRLERLVQGGGQIAATRSAIGVVRPVAMAPTYDPPPDAPYRAESVQVRSSGGALLAGTLTLPRLRPGTRVPAVVTISGSGPQDRDSFLALGAGYRIFRQIADTLSRQGIAVLRMDDRGTGASSGNFAAATEVELAADIEAAVTFLRARPDIDPRQIALIGHSEGGVIGPIVAARDSQIAALVLMAGPADPRSTVLEQNRQSIATAATLSAAQRDSLWARVPAMLDSAAKTSSWFGGFLRYDARATAARIRAPVLILHGDTDRQVPPAQAALYARYFQDGGNRDVTTVRFARRNHLFLADPDGSVDGYGRLPSMTVDREVLGTIADWLARVFDLRSARPPL